LGERVAELVRRLIAQRVRLAGGERDRYPQPRGVEVEAQVDRTECRRVVAERDCMTAVRARPATAALFGGLLARGQADRAAAWELAGGRRRRDRRLVGHREDDALRGDLLDDEADVLPCLDLLGELGVDDHAGDAEGALAGLGLGGDYARHQRAPG